MLILLATRFALAAFLACLSFLSASAFAAPHVAIPGMNRCIGADGSRVFTDRPCDTVDARPAPVAPAAPANARLAEPPTARYCARSAKTLREQVEAALASGDGNQLAALYDWRGSGKANAYAVMARLEALASSRVVAVTLTHSTERSQDPELGAEAAQVPPDSLRIELGPDGQSNGGIAEFRIVRAAGCLWLGD